MEVELVVWPTLDDDPVAPIADEGLRPLRGHRGVKPGDVLESNDLAPTDEALDLEAQRGDTPGLDPPDTAVEILVRRDPGGCLLDLIDLEAETGGHHLHWRAPVPGEPPRGQIRRKR